jgi:hypothetical protein
MQGPNPKVPFIQSVGRQNLRMIPGHEVNATTSAESANIPLYKNQNPAYSGSGKAMYQNSDSITVRKNTLMAPSGNRNDSQQNNA